MWSIVVNRLTVWFLSQSISVLDWIPFQKSSSLEIVMVMAIDTLRCTCTGSSMTSHILSLWALQSLHYFTEYCQRFTCELSYTTLSIWLSLTFIQLTNFSQGCGVWSSLSVLPAIQTHTLRMTHCRLVPLSSVSQGKQRRARLRLLPTEHMAIVLDSSEWEQWQSRWACYFTASNSMSL